MDSKFYFDVFYSDLNKVSDFELIEAFNNCVGKQVFGIPRSGYLWAIREQFKNRNIDTSIIERDSSTSFKNKIKLKSRNGNKTIEIL